MKKSSARCGFYFLSTLLIIFGIAALPALANYYIDGQGQIYFYEAGQVLGKTDNSRSIAKPTAKPVVLETLTAEATSESGTPAPSPITKKSQKIEIKAVKNQLKFQFVDNKNQPITSTESTASSVITVDESEDANEVTLISRNNASQIIRNKITAQTHFPLMVNLETNELMVTTPKGSKVVTILPDAAVAHMLAANVLDQAGGKGGLVWVTSQITPLSTEMVVTLTPTIEITPTVTPQPILADITPTPESAVTSKGITLTETADGILAYEIPGTRTKKLFGFIKITLDRVAIVSAETGELISIRQSPSAKILDIFSR